VGRRPFSTCPRAFRSGGAGLVVAIVLAGSILDAAEAPDRLDRFRHLATTRLSAAQILDTESAADGAVGAADAYREAYALLDDEIVESLATGGVFASPEFLQDRLEAFSEAWGAAVVRVMRVGPLLVGAFQLSDGLAGNSVRVYGRHGAEMQLLSTVSREGRPSVYALGAGAEPAPSFVVAWEGAATGRGTRALRLDLFHPIAEGIRLAWTTAELFPDGLYARSFRVVRGDLRLRYELQYPGWTPGCDGQTEQEDVYRLVSASGKVMRLSRQQFNVWHRDLRQSVARFFAALASGDRGAIATLVPDPRLRERLPSTLRAEPACDAPDHGNPDTVSVAAAAEHAPWQLTFRRAGAAWRLSSATPVIQ
jgi:hypothetical protein